MRTIKSVQSTNSEGDTKAATNRVTYIQTSNRTARPIARPRRELQPAPRLGISSRSWTKRWREASDGGSIQISRPRGAANRRTAPRWLASRARQSSVMLHTRIVATSRSYAWLRGAVASHGASKRTVGDRALNRGQVSREVMHENYLRMIDKFKCEWPSVLLAAAMPVLRRS